MTVLLFCTLTADGAEHCIIIYLIIFRAKKYFLGSHCLCWILTIILLLYEALSVCIYIYILFYVLYLHLF